MIFRCSLGVFSHFQTPPLRWPSDRVLTLSRFATNKQCKMWGSRGGSDADMSLLGYDTVSLGEWFLKFERTVGPLLCDKHEGTMVFLSIGNHLPNDTASHPRQLESSNRGITNSLRSCQQFKQTCYTSTWLPVLCHHKKQPLFYTCASSVQFKKHI
jgi:hypothetical protein